MGFIVPTALLPHYHFHPEECRQVTQDVPGDGETWQPTAQTNYYASGSKGATVFPRKFLGAEKVADG